MAIDGDIFDDTDDATTDTDDAGADTDAEAGPAPAPASARARAPETRERHRSRRKRVVRPRTLNLNRESRRERELRQMLFPDTGRQLPKTRAECSEFARPCPYVSCRHHLYLDVTPTGAIKVIFPDIEVEDMTESCALDVADRGGAKVEEVADAMNLTRERVRQLEAQARARVLTLRETAALRDFVEEGTADRRRLPLLVDDDDDELDAEELDAEEVTEGW